MVCCSPRHRKLQSSDCSHTLPPWLSAERDLRMHGMLTRLRADIVTVQRQDRDSVCHRSSFRSCLRPQRLQCETIAGCSSQCIRVSRDRPPTTVRHSLGVGLVIGGFIVSEVNQCIHNQACSPASVSCSAALDFHAT